MEKIREIIRLKELGKLSERAISRALKISRPVVKQYIVEIEKNGLDYSAIKEMPDDTLAEILSGSGPRKSDRYKILSGQFEYFYKELKRTGVTLQLLWEEYRQRHADGYQYSQFCHHFQTWCDSDELSMHIEHKAGDKMFVDYTGKHLSYIDPITGKIIDAEIFVAVLGASQRTYVEATETQKVKDWIKANQNAFQYFGGVTSAIVPDCLKSAVIKANRYEPTINPEYQDLARHYQTVILPARPGHPRDKALVEGAVKIVYAWIFARLRNCMFHSLEELNAAIRQELDRYNNQPMQKLRLSRNELFDEIEKNALKALPDELYVIRRFKSLKAQFNYHVYLSEDNHYYSVPYRYRGKQITAILSDRSIELFYQNRRIAFHIRVSHSKNRYSTIKEHMPPSHLHAKDWNPQRFIDWAENSGEYVQLVIERILAKSRHPEQAFKVCLGILNLEKRYSRDRINKACQRAVHFEDYSYKTIKNILDQHLEDTQPDCFQSLAEHKNLRGNLYYQ